MLLVAVCFARGCVAMVTSFVGSGEVGDIERVLADCERMLGVDHPDANAAREDLVALTGNPKRHRCVPAQRRLVDTPAVAPIAWFVVSRAGREHDHGIFAYA